MTSGDIQNGVPITVSLSAIVFINSAETPKSANFVVPVASIRIFPALISLCIFLFLCKYSNPFNVQYKTEAI